VGDQINKDKGLQAATKKSGDVVSQEDFGEPS